MTGACRRGLPIVKINRSSAGLDHSGRNLDARFARLTRVDGGEQDVALTPGRGLRDRPAAVVREDTGTRCGIGGGAYLIDRHTQATVERPTAGRGREIEIGGRHAGGRGNRFVAGKCRDRSEHQSGHHQGLKHLLSPVVAGGGDDVDMPRAAPQLQSNVENEP